MQSIMKLVIGIVPFIIAFAFMFIRMRPSNRPLSQKRIIIPPLGMSSGFLMFIYKPMQIPWQWGLVSFLVGALIFSLPLILTTKYRHIDGHIYVKRSPALILVLLGLLFIRISLHHYVNQFVTVEQTAAIFYLLAFGMILTWRISMFIYYRRNNIEPLREFLKKNRIEV